MNKAALPMDSTLDETMIISQDNLWAENNQLNIEEESCTYGNHEEMTLYLLNKLLKILILLKK